MCVFALSRLVDTIFDVTEWQSFSLSVMSWHHVTSQIDIIGAKVLWNIPVQGGVWTLGRFHCFYVCFIIYFLLFRNVPSTCPPWSGNSLNGSCSLSNKCVSRKLHAVIWIYIWTYTCYPLYNSTFVTGTFRNLKSFRWLRPLKINCMFYLQIFLQKLCTHTKKVHKPTEKTQTLYQRNLKK